MITIPRLKLKKVSRIHFSMYLEDGQLILKNNSLNGTYINGLAVEKQVIFPGDILSVLQDDFCIYKFQF